jgi:glutamine synthetase
MKKIQIESRMIGEMAIASIIPSAMKYQTALIENVKGLKEVASLSGEATSKASKKAVLAGGDFEETGGRHSATIGGDMNSLAASQMETIQEISEHISAVKNNVYKMIEVRKKANSLEDAQEKATAYCEHVKPYFDEIRYHADKLEFVVDDELWALPKYREMLFTR